MTPTQQKELKDCLELLVTQARRRSIDLKEEADLLSAIDKQSIKRAEKALRDLKCSREHGK